MAESLEAMALHAMLGDDRTGMEEALDQLLPGELRGLAEACEEVAAEAMHVRKRKRARREGSTDAS